MWIGSRSTAVYRGNINKSAMELKNELETLMKSELEKRSTETPNAVLVAVTTAVEFVDACMRLSESITDNTLRNVAEGDLEGLLLEIKSNVTYASYLGKSRTEFLDCVPQFYSKWKSELENPDAKFKRILTGHKQF